MFEIEQYNMVGQSSKATKHGGLLTYIHKDLTYTIKEFGTHSTIWESQFIEIAHNNEKNVSKSIIVGNIYRPPKSKNVYLSSFITEFSNILNLIQNRKSLAYICGDYNIDLLCIQQKRLHSEFFDLIISTGFHPKISLPTRIGKTSHTLIDNIFTNSNDLNEKSGILIYEISDHLASFTITKPLDVKNKSKQYITIENTSDMAFLKFKDALTELNLYEQLNKDHNGKVNENYNTFIDNILSAKEKHIKKKTVRFNKKKHKEQDWMTDQLLQLINYKNTLYKEFKQTHPKHEKYKSRQLNLETCQRLVKNSKETAKRNYYFKLFNKYKTDMKQTWGVINDVFRKKSEQGEILLSIKNEIITDQVAIVDHFNDFFANIGQDVANNLTKNSDNYPSYRDFLNDTQETDFKFDYVTEKTVIQLISNLKNTNTKDHDQISNKLLRTIKNEIAKPLTYIINQSLASGIFPDRLKLARVRPLFKKGDKQLITNYRPISILPVFSKIFERVVHTQLTNYFEDNDLFTKSQYGYRRGHSTELASLELTDRLYKHLGNDQVPFAIFLDLSKAFDTLNHTILLDKLEHYGIRGIAKKLLQSYLCNRTQFVQIKDTKSTIITLNIGVPQGSVLGPLLFNIYINDMKQSTNKFDCIHYADDTTLISTINYFSKSKKDISAAIDEELSKVNAWLLAQKLCLNISKTRCMLFHMPQKKVPPLTLSINNIAIENVKVFNYLGLMLDTNLKWNPHVQKVGNKISQINGVINKLKFEFPQRVLIMIYNSLIESHVNYCLILWGTNYDRIYKLQKKAVRSITLSHFKAHTSPIFKMLGLLDIRDMYKLNLLKLYYKLRKSIVPSYFNHLLDDVTQLNNNMPVKYNLRHKRVNIPIVPREFLKRNTQYQLLELVSKFDKGLLQRAEHYSMKSYVLWLKQHFLSQYNVTCDIENCYVCNSI